MNMKQRTLPGIEFAGALSRQLVSSQSYLLGRFVKWAARAWHRVSDHAPRLENTAPFLRRDPPHSLRGNGPLAAILQQTQAALVAPKLCQAAATEPQLSSLRFHPGAVVRHHGRTPTHQQDRNSAVQRYLPVLAGPLAVPRPVHLAPIPEREEYPIRPSARQLARSMARSTPSSAPTANHPQVRSRFCRPDRLRQTTIRSRRVQPQETQPTFLPAADLLRGSLARDLAWLCGPAMW